MHRTAHTGGRQVRRAALVCLALLAALSAGACEGLLDVELLGNVVEEDLANPVLANPILLSAVNDFECSLSDYILSTGLWNGELMDASTWTNMAAWQTRRTTVDSGNGPCATEIFRGGGTIAPYLKLQIARVGAARAHDLIKAMNGVKNQQSMLATAMAYEGYATTLLGESYCDMRLDAESPLVKPDAVLKQAAERFATARTLAQAANNTQVLNLARVGGARVAMRLGLAAEAKTLAAAVPKGFLQNATTATTPVRRANWVYAYNRLNLMVSVAAVYRNLTVDGVPDARVQLEQRTDLAPNDGRTQIWLARMYPDLGSPVAMATWQEAQLLVAEAEAAAGNAAAAVAAINQVRQFYKLPDYAGGSLAEVKTQLIEERRRQLFLQGHRLGDILQYKLPFQQGLDHRGRAYTATSTCLPIPEKELS